jgi:hypothetical protein
MGTDRAPGPGGRHRTAASRLRTAFSVALATGFVAPGCMNPKGVPGGASLVTEATVKSSFQSPADGMLYIYRRPARGQRGQLHYSGPILAGQTLVIDPAMKEATLDGQPLNVVLPSGDVLYQAYFRRDPTVRQAVLAVPRYPRDVREASGTMRLRESSPGGAAGDTNAAGSAIESEARPDSAPTSAPGQAPAQAPGQTQ